SMFLLIQAHGEYPAMASGAPAKWAGTAESRVSIVCATPHMTKTAKSPSTWFLSRARTTLWPLVPAVLVAMFLVPAAHASGTSTADREQVSLASETAPPAAEPPPTASETLPPPASEPPPPVSEAPPPSDE